MNNNEWKPIETAPKDGTEIIGLYYNGGIECIRLMWYLTSEVAILCGNNQDEAWWSRRSSVTQEIIEPTHWMPLPKLPTQ
jgi:hypothetical protein